MTGVTAGQADVMPDSAVLRAAILATEPASGAAPEWTDRSRLDGIVASWIGRALPPGTPSSVAADAAQRVTGGLAPFVEAEALQLAQAAIAAQQPQPAPGRAELETAMAAALQDLIDEDEAQPAPEADEAIADRDKLRAGYAALCGEFNGSPEVGRYALISLTELNRHRKAVGLDPFRAASWDGPHQPAAGLGTAWRLLDQERERLATMRALADVLFDLADGDRSTVGQTRLGIGRDIRAALDAR